MISKKTWSKSKILATLGPACGSAEQIQDLIDMGMDCARINFSHGDLKDKTDLFHRVRGVDSMLPILCDIQGPKIRIGVIKDHGVHLMKDSKIILTTDEVIGDENRISISFKKLHEEIEPGDAIFINDGLIRLKALEVRGNDIHCYVEEGGNVTNRKGVNLPGTQISLKVPTDKDIKDLREIAKLDPEFVAVSFVGDANDVKNVRNLLDRFGNSEIKLISKIERPIALENFDEILEESDGIMVARGDLGVELNPWEVPKVQKEIIRKCNIEAKPVIVATQMLESMIKSPIPTRAEVSDVYNAIIDGADAVMLSAETAAGEHPSESVAMIMNIIKKAESEIPMRSNELYDSKSTSSSELLGHLAYSACWDIGHIKKEQGSVLCLTESGYTARMISKYRPFLPIIGVTENLRVAREMNICWGLEPLLVEPFRESALPMTKIKVSVQMSIDQELLHLDDMLVVLGNFFNLSSRTNMLFIFPVDEVLSNQAGF